MAEVYNSASDFVLFPRDQAYPDTFDLRAASEFQGLQYNPSFASDMHRHRDFSGCASASYESYPPISAHSSAYFAPPNAPFDAHKQIVGQFMPRNPSSGSPSPSISYTFDHPPSTISSASGASAHSTASSADGSPYVNATHILPYHEKWTEPLHGLGITPEIVTGETFNNDPFPPSSFDNEVMLESIKFANYIGEYGKNSSQSFPISRPMTHSIPSALASQSFVPAFSFPTLALDTTTGPRDVTIDSILEEANSKIKNSTHLISPISAASTAASPTPFADRLQNVSPNEARPSFRSPRTPASSTSRFPSRAGSPHSSGDPKFQRLPLDRARMRSGRQLSSNRFSPYSRPPPSNSSHGQSHYEKTQNQFFDQSSGRYVAPLESSCWFSLLCPFRFSLPRKENTKNNRCLIYSLTSFL